MIKISYLARRIKEMNIKAMFERVKLVSKKAKKSKVTIFFDMIWCGLRYGAGYVDYDVIGFYKLTGKQRKTMLTRGINNKFVRELNDKEYWHIFNNKNEFNKTFSRFVNRDWIYPIKQSKEKAIEWIKAHEIFFAKPNNGQCGKGIEKINTKDWEENNKLEDLYVHLLENNLELLEEPIKQHETMNKLNPSSVNTIRMVTIMNEQKEVTILTAFVRIGNGKCVDNFNSGGMTARVDVEKGIIKEEAVNKKGEIFLKHPTTKVMIKGFKIPNWEEAKRIVIEAAKLSENVRYIGWDVAITQEGCALVEGNHFPGHDIYQVAEKMKEGQLGILPEFKKALQSDSWINTGVRKVRREIGI